ncbi:unnamed protein product [Schistosoma turkestanicum]|nr:unnamed protein product [Schistosoma turkestanicum]
MDKAANQKPETLTNKQLASLAVDRTQTTCLTSGGNNLVKTHMSYQSYDGGCRSADLRHYPTNLTNQSSLKESTTFHDEDHISDIKPTINSSSGQQKHGLIKKLLHRTNSNNTHSNSEKLKILELRSHRRPQQTTEAFQRVMGNVHHGGSNPIYGTAISSGSSGNNATVPHSPDENSSNKLFNKTATNTKSHDKHLIAHNLPTHHQQQQSSSSSSITADGKTNNPPTTTATTTITGISSTSSSNNNTTNINGLLTNASNNLKITATTPNETIAQLQEIIAHLTALINVKDQRIQELERDKDKLHSVLHQQITNHWDDTSSPVDGLKVIHEDLPSISETNVVTQPINDDKRNDSESHSPSSSSSTPAGSPPVTTDVTTTPPPAAALLLRKRLGVSGESMKCAQELVYHDKDANSRRQIREALRSNDLIKNLDAVQLQEVVSCMHEQTVAANCYIIREGEDGGHLYVGEGKCNDCIYICVG